MPIPQCPVCASKLVQPVARYRGHSPLFCSRNLVKCGECELVFADPMPSEAELLEYNRSYFESAHDGRPSSPDALAFFHGMAKLRLQHILSYLAPAELDGASILEVGPGLGHLCEHVIRRCPNVDYVVVETDRGCQEHLRALGARVYERMEQIDESSARFDLLILSHVLEHASDPIVFLKPAVEALKPGGTVFIEVPCRDHEHKPDIEPHLLFFDKPSMERLLAGLGLVDLQPTYHGQALGMINHRQTILGRGLRRFRRLISPLVLRLDLAPRIKGIENSAERAAIAPYEPHLTKDQPSWWLRAMARKPLD